MRTWGGFLSLLLLATALAGRQALAQAPPPWDYYPLGVGDVWEYDEQWRGTTLRVANVVDTVIAGRSYVVQTRTRFDSLGNATEAFPRSSIRFDSTTTFVMRAAFTMPGEEFVWGRTPCPLNAQPPSANCEGSTWTVQAYIANLTVGDTTLSGVQHKWFGINGHYFVLAAGLGEVLRQPKFDPPDVLIYARIDGVEYGSPRYPVAEQPVPEPAGALALSVWPNPVRGGVIRVVFTLPAPARARVELVDALGRTVHSVDLGVRPAGRHEMPVGLALLAPGPYTVRLTAGAASTVGRVTFLR
jgi:hypothetical protein